jgi:predicted secreted hydrolase
MPAWIIVVCLLLYASPTAADEFSSWPRADPAYRISFPRDEGSHPAFAGEWWYITGWLETPEQQSLGFQVTFFRLRKKDDAGTPQASMPGQVLVGHAALSDARRGRASHEQRSAPFEPGRAEAREGAMDIRIDDWSLRKGMSRSVLKFARQASLVDQARRPWLAVQGWGW